MKNINKLLLLCLLAVVFITPNITAAMPADFQIDVDPQGSSSCVNLQNNLRYRMTDAQTNGEVTVLQDFLQSSGYLNTNPVGFFGLLTTAAVKKFQSTHSIAPTGYVGPLTRAQIKVVSCSGSTIDTPPTIPPIISINGCAPGALFSTTTGAPCTTIPTTTDGCATGAKFSSTTGLPCAPSPTIVAPTIQILSPNNTETWVAGKSYDVKWTTSGVSKDTMFNIRLRDFYTKQEYNLPPYPASSYNDGIENVTVPSTVPGGTYILEMKGVVNGETKIFSNGYFMISPANDAGCSAGQVYSSTTGFRCPGDGGALSITIAYPPDGNTTYAVQDNGYFAIPFSWSANRSLVYPWIYLVNANAGINDPAVASINLPANTQSGQGLMTSSALVNAGTLLPAGQYKMKLCDQSTGGLYPICGVSIRPFSLVSVTSPIDTGCSAGQVYSSTTGARCPTPTVGDLAVTDFSWTPVNPAVNQTDPYLYFTGTIKNIGATSLFIPTETGFAVTNNGTVVGKLTIGTGTFTLASGESKTFTFTSIARPNILSQVGQTNLTFSADSSNLVAEANESNNSLTKSITIQATSLPSIAVLSPNGGEVVDVSRPVTVSLKSNNVYPAKHYINLVDETLGRAYSLDSLLGSYGAMFTQAQIDQGSQSITVSIPSSYNLNTNDKYKIEICVNNICDKSDSYFTITSGNVPVNSPPKIYGFPGVPVSIQPGQLVNFSWTASDANNDDLAWSVNFGDGPQPSQPCASPHPRTSKNFTYSLSHTWYQAGTYTVKASVSDCVGGTDSHTFSVVVGPALAPSVSVLSPSLGEDLKEGAQYTIRWSSKNLPPDAQGYITVFHGAVADGTSPNTVVAGNLSANTNSYTWTIKSDNGWSTGVGVESWPEKIAKFFGIPSANASANQYFVEVRYANLQNGYLAHGTSPAFTISPVVSTQPSITVTSPRSGDIFAEGKPVNITWNTSGLSPYQGLDIMLNVGSGGTQPIAYNTSNTGSYTWTAKSFQPSGQYSISVVCPVGKANCNFNPNSGQSGAFTITPVPTTAIPVVRLSASPTTILSDGKPGATTLTWTSTNATYCMVERQQMSTSGSLSVPISQTGNYTVSCTGPGGTASSNSVTVTFQTTTPAPSLTSISPTSATKGTMITINGSGFKSIYTIINFRNGTFSQDVSPNSVSADGTQIKVIVPYDFALGTYATSIVDLQTGSRVPSANIINFTVASSTVQSTNSTNAASAAGVVQQFFNWLFSK